MTQTSLKLFRCKTKNKKWHILKYHQFEGYLMNIFKWLEFDLLQAQHPCHIFWTWVIPAIKFQNLEVGLCSPLLKMFEGIISDHLKEFVDSNNMLPPFQSGFRKKNCTVTAVLKVQNDLIEALDSKKYCMAVFFLKLIYQKFVTQQTSCLVCQLPIQQNTMFSGGWNYLFFSGHYKRGAPRFSAWIHFISIYPISVTTCQMQYISFMQTTPLFVAVQPHSSRLLSFYKLL